MTEALDPLRLPLWGSRLIEASAGTGKTWTIAALYLRLVLGHGGAMGPARALQPAEILVMTFTRAATRELSDRIRQRLLQAACCFRGECEPADPLLADLRAEYAPGAARELAAWRLGMAALAMDDAAVHTIDAWCQRMLREHAFDSACLFDEELNADEGALHDEAALDYWRQQVYPLHAAELEQVLAVWPSAASLAADTRAVLRHELPADAGQGALGPLIGHLASQRLQAVMALKAGWAGRAQRMQDWLDAQVAPKVSIFDRTKVQSRYYKPWLDGIAAWADEEGDTELTLSPKAVRLTPAGLQEALRDGAQVDLPADFAAFETLLLALPHLPTLAPGLRLHAAACIARRVALLKAQAGSYGFADMLSRLDAALDDGGPGPAPVASAARLRARILAQYPVALVDEFQDTSPVQVRILYRLYGLASLNAETALLLIGDPKQSIYGFRGADIYSYLQARRATAGRHYALATNHRSTAGLVAAVNHLFGQAEARAGVGAFLFRAAASVPAGDADPLPFVAVAARSRAERWVTSAGVQPALQIELDDTLRDMGSSRRQAAARCAEQIATLLNDPGAGFEDGEAGFVRLRPADIAVLVRTGKEAAAVRRELRRRQVASVYLSDKDSVLASPEALDIHRWLQAVAAPRDVRLARAALATATVGLSMAELALLASDDEAFDERCEQLRQLQATWQNQGVLSMLRQTLHLLALPGRWLGTVGGAAAPADGERRLTNFLHVAELLQGASAMLDGEPALIRWLGLQITGGGVAGDEQVVRLESDADLVQLITIHKSKGLEYPLVFVPFASHFRGVDKARTTVLGRVDGRGGRTLELQPDDEDIAAADRERLREDLRLLYVALTRARHALWLGLAALQVGPSPACVWHRSAAGQLLSGEAAMRPGDLLAALLHTLQPCAAIALQAAVAAEDLACTQWLARGPATPLLAALPYSASFERHWSIGSFSGLVRALAGPGAAPASITLTAARDDETTALAAPAVRPAAPEAAAGSAPWHTFTRGAVAGNLVHDQLEWLAGEGFARIEETPLQQQLLRRLERSGWGHRGADLLAWLRHAVATPLPPLGAPLQALQAPAARLPELEFWLPSAGLVSADVDALCRQHLLPGVARPALPERELRGLLMGFADLVFEHGGRYWVLDYKTNHLGPRDADYSADALAAAMAEHRYDVQAAIYLLALHRLLRARLGPAYKPAQHLGGAIYLFLRGFQGPAAGCVHLAAPTALLDGLDALLGDVSQGA